MLVPVTTVPGGAGGVSLQFATQQNAQLASQLLSQVYAAANAGQLNLQNAPTVPASNPGELNVFILGDELGDQDSGPDQATVPSGYGIMIDAFTFTPATIVGAQNQFGEEVLSGQGGLTFYTEGGSGTLIAGGGNNVVAPGPDAPASEGGWTLLFDGGNNTVTGSNGNLLIDDGSSGAAGSNLIYLGSGSDTVQSWGIDTITAAPGGSELVVTYHAGTVFYGGDGPSEVMNQGGADTIVQGGGPETVYAEASGGVYFGGLGALTFISAPDVDSTLICGVGDEVMFGAPNSNNLIFVGPGQFMLLGGSSNDTVVAQAGYSSGALMYSDGGSITLFGDTDANFLIAGSGNTTLNAAGASGDNELYAGTGNDLMVVGSGTNVLVAGPGSDTMVGGSGMNLFEVNAAFAGGSEFIVGWNSQDQLYLSGYGPPAAKELPAGTAVTLVNGSRVLTLPDGTSITFIGVSRVGHAHFHTS